ncbi:hypothetical protein AcW1_006105 [Taiwanofungus camphoratus]|nr:hypothetical protein AcW1_006105 [Antrodia cinnamomea]
MSQVWQIDVTESHYESHSSPFCPLHRAPRWQRNARSIFLAIVLVFLSSRRLLHASISSITPPTCIPDRLLSPGQAGVPSRSSFYNVPATDARSFVPPLRLVILQVPAVRLISLPEHLFC